jgi:hypothetical protein
MEVSGQLQGRVALTAGKSTQIPTEQESGWAEEPDCGDGKKIVPVENRTLTVEIIARRYID